MPRHRTFSRAFTLVELLVVIGIIAVLVSVLLPALGAARRQAAAVKCATQLREIGNAFQMYAMENRGYFPPSQIQPAGAFKYNVDGVDYPVPGSTLGAYWFTFLAKYATKSKVGYAGQSVTDAEVARKTVFWGCPNWEPFRTAAATAAPLGGVNPVQIGYGMTWWPTFTATHPAIGATYPPTSERTFISSWSPLNPNVQQGNFIKQKVFGKNGSQRALVADSRFWALDSQAVPVNGVIAPQPNIQNVVDYTRSAGQTYADLYRHGKYPPRLGAQEFSNVGGKVGFNILYCDGHVATTNDPREAFRAVRQRFPR